MKPLLIQSLVQIVAGTGAIVASVQRKPIPRGRHSPEPFPNQTFIRSAFLIVGLALIIGAFWNLWLTRRASL